MTRYFKGIGLSIGLGGLALLLSRFTPAWLNSILLALLLGIVISNSKKLNEAFSEGINFTSGKMLELSVVFLAFNINFSNYKQLGWSSFLMITIVVFVVLALSYYLSVKLKCPEASGWMIGFGTAICGSSAIAALAPNVAKNKANIGIAMAVVNLLGTLAMLFMPWLLLKMNYTNQEVGTILGATLHSVGNVAGSAFALNQEVGEAAIAIKLARVALLSPALLFFLFLVRRSNAQVSNGARFSLPWYLWLFIIITVLGSFLHFPKPMVDVSEQIGKIILTLAMAAIGLKISIKNLLSTGRKGFLFGAIIFAVQVALVMLLMAALH